MMKFKSLALSALAISATLFSGISTGFSAPESTDQIIIPFKRFGLDWRTELPDKVKILRIWSTLDNGHTWKQYSETTNPTSPAPVKVTEDGTYGIYTQAIDISDLAEAAPVPGTPPKIFVVVDTKKPALVLVNPNTAQVYSNSQDLRVEWNASDINFGPTPVSLYYSKDGGGTWNVIKKGLPNAGTYVWKIPAESTQFYRVKIVAEDLAGNESEDISDTNFIVDGKPPVTRVMGPRDSKSPVFDVTYRAQDLGGAGIAKVQIYFQMGDNNEWHYYGEDKDLKSPFSFEAKQGGRYGFKLVATDRVGNSEKVPTATTRPDLWCLMDSMKPVVKLTSFKGTNLKPLGKGNNVNITWEATDNNMAQRPISIELSLNDGATWTNIVTTDFQNSGVFPWTVPDFRKDGKDPSKCRLKITALDLLGNKGVDVSDMFALDSYAPVTTLSIKRWQGDAEEMENSSINNNIRLAPTHSTRTPEKTVSEYISEAVAALNINDYFTAENMAKKALDIDANNYMVHALFGRVYLKQEKRAKAINSYSRSIELNTNYQTSHIGLGISYFETGRAVAAEDNMKARTYFKKAALEYEAAVAILPDTWDEHFNLGYIYARLQRYEDAITYFSKAVPLSEDNGDAYWFLGQVYEKLNNLPEALKNYESSVKAYKDGSTIEQKAKFKVRDLKAKMSK
jgi:Tfp pilus assembly protein PilF